MHTHRENLLLTQSYLLDYLPKVNDLCVQQNIKATTSGGLYANQLLVAIQKTKNSRQTCTHTTVGRKKKMLLIHSLKDCSSHNFIISAHLIDKIFE